jgi:hypothetical protein
MAAGDYGDAVAGRRMRPAAGPVIVPKSPPEVITDRGIDHLAAVRLVAKAMDTAFVIPGTRFRFGLDALIGLIPGIGDVVGAGVGMYIVYAAARLGVSRAVLARMLLNVGADAAVGAVPLAGDVLDAAWRANTRNVALLEQALREPQAARRASLWMVVGALLAVVALAAGGLFLTVYLARLAWNAAG